MRRRRYAVACDPGQIIRTSPQTEIVRHRNGDTPDIIETILYMDGHATQWVNVDNVECLRGATNYDTLHNVWQFVKRNLRYQADRPGHERVKSPGALYSSGHGDCKSFSIAEGALLKALGVPYRYRFAAYEPGDFTHVYIVATIDGRDVVMDAVHTDFDAEVPYRKKKDIGPASGAIAGIPTTRPQPTRWGGWIAAGLLLYILLK